MLTAANRYYPEKCPAPRRDLIATTRKTRAPRKAASKTASKIAGKTAITADAAVPKAKPSVEKVVRPASGGMGHAMFRRFVDADLLSQAAALAFYAVLSLAPLLLLVLWLADTLLPSAQDALMGQIGLLAGSDAQRVAQSVVDGAKAQPDTQSIAGWWSILWLFVGATAVFAQLQDVLNRIFRTDATHLLDVAAWLRKRILSFGLVFGVGFLLLVSLTVTTLLKLVFAHFNWILPLMALLVSWLVYAISFALMFHFLPDRRVHWRRALMGGALTSAFFLVGRALIGWYLGQVPPTSTYGSMGTMALALLWIYYVCLVVFVGALLTAVIDERQRIGVTE